MAVERRRGCGYRKVGGLYLVCDGPGVACDRLPWPLTVCPTCSAGIKQSRGWTWVAVEPLVGGVHPQCADEFPCPLCMAPAKLGRAGLLWVGEKFYATPDLFMQEAREMGISRRVAAVPREFKLGETWVLLAHAKAVMAPLRCPKCNCAVTYGPQDGPPHCSCQNPNCDFTAEPYTPGIFQVFKPQRVEKLITNSQATPEELEHLAKQGITPIVVPDDDPDHQGSAHDKQAQLTLEEAADG